MTDAEHDEMNRLHRAEERTQAESDRLDELLNLPISVDDIARQISRMSEGERQQVLNALRNIPK